MPRYHVFSIAARTPRDRVGGSAGNLLDERRDYSPVSGSTSISVVSASIPAALHRRGRFFYKNKRGTVA
jgi:hypothetical protein